MFSAYARPGVRSTHRHSQSYLAPHPILAEGYVMGKFGPKPMPEGKAKGGNDPQPGDELVGQWERQRLEQMDAKFHRAMSAALQGEQPGAGTVTVKLR